MGLVRETLNNSVNFVEGGALYFSPEKCCKLATACFCLHNICKRKGIEMEEMEADNEIGVN